MTTFVVLVKWLESWKLHKISINVQMPDGTCVSVIYRGRCATDDLRRHVYDWVHFAVRGAKNGA